MHELAVCQALVRTLEALDRPTGARVKAVRVRVGPLCGVDAALLAHAYPIACAGGIGEGSQLEVEPVAVRVRCRSCGAESSATPNRLLCARCGDWRTELLSGDELSLAAVVFESPAQEPAHV